MSATLRNLKLSATRMGLSPCEAAMASLSRWTKEHKFVPVRGPSATAKSSKLPYTKKVLSHWKGLLVTSLRKQKTASGPIGPWWALGKSFKSKTGRANVRPPGTAMVQALLLKRPGMKDHLFSTLAATSSRSSQLRSSILRPILTRLPPPSESELVRGAIKASSGASATSEVNKTTPKPSLAASLAGMRHLFGCEATMRNQHRLWGEVVQGQVPLRFRMQTIKEV
mmetsp:Transcript_71811/g.150025  ORF Transcript_71811/g.150025 Transcript_71811/m.150025 type:complete len:225 (-) Transcript_71811:247-921(-)